MGQTQSRDPEILYQDSEIAILEFSKESKREIFNDFYPEIKDIYDYCFFKPLFEHQYDEEFNIKNERDLFFLAIEIGRDNPHKVLFYVYYLEERSMFFTLGKRKGGRPILPYFQKIVDRCLKINGELNLLIDVLNNEKVINAIYFYLKAGFDFGYVEKRNLGLVYTGKKQHKDKCKELILVIIDQYCQKRLEGLISMVFADTVAKQKINLLEKYKEFTCSKKMIR